MDDGSQFNGYPSEPRAEGGVESSPLVSRDQQWNVPAGEISEKPAKLLLKRESAWNMQIKIVPVDNTLSFPPRPSPGGRR